MTVNTPPDVTASQKFRQQVQGGSDSAAQAILQAAAGEWEVDNAFDLDPVTFLTFTYRQDLNSGEHEIFREALLQILNGYASAYLEPDDDQLATLLYIAQVASLPRTRRSELTQLIRSCLRSAESRDLSEQVGMFLNLAADEDLITNLREWEILHTRFGSRSTLAVFYAMARLDLYSALAWLLIISEHEDVEHGALSLVLPSILKTHRPTELLRMVRDIDLSEHQVPSLVRQRFTTLVQSIVAQASGLRPSHPLLVQVRQQSTDAGEAVDPAVDTRDDLLLDATRQLRVFLDTEVDVWDSRPDTLESRTYAEHLLRESLVVDVRPGEPTFYPPAVGELGVASDA